MLQYQWILLTCNLFEGPAEKWLCLFSRTHPVFSQSSFIVGLCLLSFVLYIFYLAGDSFCQCLLLCLNKKIGYGCLLCFSISLALISNHGCFKHLLFHFLIFSSFLSSCSSLMHWPSKSLCWMNLLKMFLQRPLFSGYCSCPVTAAMETHTELRKALKSDLLR